MTAAAGLARAIQQTGWDVVVDFDKEAEWGDFNVYIGHERVFCRQEKGRVPDASEILPLLEARLSGGEVRGDES
ncbi:Rdx family protein [Geomonas sp. Red32]|uniref:Rdx family protein n=1 Tax=Geomonas sp. Red32 TaxID=2912856 RepID=UPI00202CC98B|nr:Rdx family protein [Geomonas sp. Red32]MCM0082145.1 Rdx family protein [Geomonas sp. Red32]